MGSSNNHPADIDPQALNSAKALWSNFTEATKWGVVAVVVLLLGMAFFLV